MAAKDRSTTVRLAVAGLDGVKRDFKAVATAGSAAFKDIENAAERTAKATKAATSPKASKITGRGAAGAGFGGTGFNPKALGGVGDANDTLDIFVPNADAATAASGRMSTGFALATIAASALVAGLLAVGYGMFTTAQAYAEHERALDAFNATLDLAGNLSTATSGQISQMAQNISTATLQTEKSVLSAAASLAQVPGITEAALQSALEASAQLADTLRVDVTETAKQTGEILTALADRDMKALIAAMDGLGPSLQLVVLNLAEAGKTAEAQTALIKGLTDAAGDGPNGLATATDRVSDSWARFKVSLGETSAGPVVSVLDFISSRLDNLRNNADAAGVSILQALQLQGSAAFFNQGFGPLAPRLDIGGAEQDRRGSGFNSRARGGVAAIRRSAQAVKDRRTLAAKKKFYGGGAKSRRGGGGGGGKSSAQREAEQAARAAEALAKKQAGEADRAREAADRITESNRDVIESYKLRAAEATAKIGLEGAALKAVERAQEIEAAERRINTDLIEKEVEARRAAAVVAKEAFNVPLATEEARRAVALQSAEVRLYAAALIDAGDAIDLFNEKQAFAKALFEETRTPVEALVLEAKRLSEEFNRLGGDTDAFNRKMDQLAEQIVDAADRSKNAWVGFGDDVGGVFADLLLNGGSARDLLQELIRLPLERLIQQNVQNPIAGFIDGLTGNNRDKNIAATRATLPTASDGAAVSVTALGGSAQIAADALATIPVALQTGLGNPLADLAIDAEGAGKGLGDLIPLTGQFGGALGQLIASLAGGTGGSAGGILGAVLGIASSALGAVKGSGLAIDGGPLGKSLPGVEAVIASLPGRAGGGYAPRSGAFYVGENGREVAEYTSQGLKIHSNDNVRRMEANSGPSFVNYQTINVPERADPCRTGSYFARQTQGAIARTAKKGLGAGPRWGGK